MDRLEYTTLIQQIVEKRFADEIELFNDEGKNLIQKLSETPPEIIREGGFPFDLHGVYPLLPVILQTYKLIIELIEKQQKEKNTPDLSEIQQTWQKRLIASGLDVDTANAVSKDFSTDIESIVQRSK